MDTAKLLEEISAKDFDIDQFVQLALHDDQMRDEIVLHMRSHPHIMVYYHCFYVVSKASIKRPDLFYPYWDDVAALLKHDNSYHRDFALTIIATLTQVDQADLFSGLFDDYFEHINDEKFMTGQCCVQNSLKILRHKPEWRDQIITLLLDVDNRCSYPEKQKELLKCDVIQVLAEVDELIKGDERVSAFIRAGVSSISPKMRRTAKALVAKYNL